MSVFNLKYKSSVLIILGLLEILLCSNKVYAQNQDTSPDIPAKYYIVSGDTLWNISQRFEVDLELLILTNNIKNPNLIYPGQEIIIPTYNDVSEISTTKTKVILIDISDQKLYVYEGGCKIKEFLVSTGTPEHPTVLGTYSIWIKLESTRMKGQGYDLPNVPWTMYFYNGYGIHGTYWHDNFGHPMSHGCINMRTSEAKWLFHWAEIGTEVIIIN